MKIADIRHDHNQAGALNAMIPLWGFVDRHSFITKSGHVGSVIALKGFDYESADDRQREHVANRFKTAMRGLDDSTRVYQYLFKSPVPDVQPSRASHPVVDATLDRHAKHLNARRSNRYAYDVYLVILRPVARPSTSFWNTVRTMFTGSSQRQATAHEIAQAAGRLAHTVESVMSLLDDVLSPVRLTATAAYQVFRRLVNYAPVKQAQPLLRTVHLDYLLSDSSVECYGDHLRVDGYTVKVLTQKEPPAHTFPLMLDRLYQIPCAFVACLEWQTIHTSDIRKRLKSAKRHFYMTRTGIVQDALRSDGALDSDRLVDESKDALAAQIGAAQIDLESGTRFGDCTLSLCVYDRQPEVAERATADVVKTLALHGGQMFEEGYNLLNAWLAMIPGNTAYNVRNVVLTDHNLADLSFLFTLSAGEPRNAHLNRESLITLDTRQHTRFHVNLHYNDVGHTFVMGMPGSGKSFLMNALLMHAQKYEPSTVVFDLGHSYRQLATALGGSYLQLGLFESQINPFAFDPTPEHLHFVHGFVKVLLADTAMTAQDDRELYMAILDLYRIEAKHLHRLSTLTKLVPKTVADRLEQWVDGGRYGRMFDNLHDTLTVDRFQVFEFEKMREFPDILEPLLFYILHRVHDRIGDGLTICAMDEAWRFVQHPALASYVQEALKTWRKHNACMWLASQAADDFTGAGLLRTVVESCPTKLLLANPSFDRDQYRVLFGLNDQELDHVASLSPRRELLFSQPGRSKVLALDVDTESAVLFGARETVGA